MATFPYERTINRNHAPYHQPDPHRVVTEVDRENWLCRVKTGELETNWISWLTLRAGNARTWWRPSEGEQVVLLSLGGNLKPPLRCPLSIRISSHHRRRRRMPA